MERSRLVINIEFGASKTVVGYHVTTNGWNGLPTFLQIYNTHIIPTAIAYTQGDLSCCIGTDAQRRKNCIYWIKHIFDDARILRDSDDELLKELVGSTWPQLPRRQREDPSLVVSDFLGKLLGHLQSALKDDPTLNGMPKHFIFTTPSTWSSSAHMKMEQAVYSAGFTSPQGASVSFTSEAEAVAVYAASEGGFNMGQLCELQSLVYAKALQQSRTSGRMTRSKVKLLPFAEWARQKFPYGLVSMPTNTGLLDAALRLIYNSVANKIISHIRREIACANICAGCKVIKKLLLVGGLSGSAEISNAIQEACTNELEIEFHQPQYDFRNIAVCIGGTLRGLTGPQLSFKFWRYYYLVYANRQTTMIVSKGSPYDNEYTNHIKIILPRSTNGSHHILVVESAQQVSQLESLEDQNKVVGRINCDLSQVPGNWQLLNVLVNYRATVRSEGRHLPPERLLHLAVHESESEEKRLIGHTRVLMQSGL
ncbi:hypothetical protein BO83DRAFT_415957 [Aspergillus eucalypticola CBS 122712]|uniref:Actin-like ATPase domain-containing protein n=1 Tax=Aspergillus eucalypticola (strain CBS 122712 / IBT 29274) TaxID=1448314 RepID=A0A317VQG2_ASPEC|nr:uncharacterized protein BO83DRAFT_415957 [Aspergillus eucalypticola CBS 122712]PWY76614.1 hypothetical protein BO83DRAFT_415957 [Aspergillus eucalypticola CBS 122712]